MNRSCTRIVRVLVTVLFVMIAPSALVQAQGTIPIAIRVRVVDSAHAAIANADVAVVHGLNEVLASGTTDRNGIVLLHASPRFENYQVVVRRVGYARASRFLLGGRADSLNADITLPRATQRLDTVKVVAEVNKTRERTFIDADAIAASDRPLVDAIDVIEKLRPSMTMEPPNDVSGHCLPARNLWVNGVRVAYTPPGRVIVDRRQVAPTARPSRALRLAPPDAIVALSSIKPEHIASIDYRNCFSTTVDRVGGESALYVTLKDGIAFRLGEGSYVMSAAEQDSILKSIIRH